VGNGPSQTHTIVARTVDVAGQVSGAPSASGRSADPSIEVYNTGVAGGTGTYIGIKLHNFNANSTYSVCFNSANGGFYVKPSINGCVSVGTDGNGELGATQTQYYYGYPGTWVTATTAGVTGTDSSW
jgi:hypothetical protein